MTSGRNRETGAKDGEQGVRSVLEDKDEPLPLATRASSDVPSVKVGGRHDAVTGYPR
jgi:hypothetical protein